MNISSDGIITIRPANATKRIFITGDACLRGIGETRVLDGQSANILAPMRPFLDKADLSITQFETVLTTADTPIVKSGPNIRSNPQTIDFFHAWNGQVCLLANNHTGDYGPQPLLDTIDLLHRHGFQTVGAGPNLDAAYKPLITACGSLKIGILNVCENEFGGAHPDRPGSAPLNPSLQVRQILALKPQVDLVMVVVHGGNEQNPIPSPRVVDMLRTFADVGADIVVNIHTHCPQGIEIWNGTPIVYSLGNFFFSKRIDDTATYKPEDFWYTGYCVAFDVDAQGCAALQVIPTHFGPDAADVHPLAGKQFDGFIDYFRTISAPLADFDAIRRYHECWAAMSSYISLITSPRWTQEDFTHDEPEHKAKLMALRNIFTCEAHCEILQTYLKLYEQGRLADALVLKDDIKQLQKAVFMRD